jgi:hypothetical protein
VDPQVLAVRAVDGDRGIDNPILYSVTGGPAHLFGVNRNTGVVFVKAPLDRESGEARNGAFILEVTAMEVRGPRAGGGGGRPWGQAIATEVTVILEDINDEVPRFRSPAYMAEIAENAQKNTPVTWLGRDTVAEVFDHDLGTNGTFKLFLEGDRNIFEVTPALAINDASFMVRVRDQGRLDYEAVKEINFTLVAREVTAGARESRVPVTVHIRDINDNPPEFLQARYTVTVPEDIGPGERVARVQAVDRDSGLFGTEGIRYTSVTGPASQALVLHPLTGIITVGEGAQLDRERQAAHYFTVEARDERGRGSRNTVELVVRLSDVNDNAPRFWREQYESFLTENTDAFQTPLIIQAEDRDENGTGNAMVRYRIVEGDNKGNFTIDSLTGEVRPTGVLDYELISGRDDERVYNMTVRAFDLGTPSLWADVPVRVFVLDQNDHAPQFESHKYWVDIPEDTPGGTPVLKVRATDGDGSAPNNHVVYRIQAGARDKFVIRSGRILVL